MSLIGDTPEEHRRHIPHGAFLGQWFMGPENVRIMHEAGGLAVGIYQSVVAKQTGALAASARHELNIGGEKNDRIVADVIVGEGTPRGGYGASHEFGIGIHPESRVPPTPWMPQLAVNDLVKVLAIMDSLT